MDRKAAAAEIRQDASRILDSILEKDQHNGYVCPACGSGSGSHGTGLTTKDGVHYKCWACDNIDHADVFDLVGNVFHLEHFPDKLRKACELAGISLEAESDSPTFLKTKPVGDVDNDDVDYSTFYERANKNLSMTDYHRGLSIDTLNRFSVGFITEWRHPKVPKAPMSPRLIIPTSKSSYLARDVRDTESIPESQQPYTKSKVGSVHFFNESSLRQNKSPVVIVEGEMDALSVIDVGYEAVAIGSTAYVNRFLATLTEIAEQRSLPPLVISMDDDDAGIQATKKLEAGLQKLNICFVVRSVSNGYKDANAALMADRDSFSAAVEASITASKTAAVDEIKRRQSDHVLSRSNRAFMQHFVDEAVGQGSFTSTGFSTLDKLLCGGLYPDFFALGAVSSLGKTTFALQLADNIACAGRDVIFVALEMSRDDLIAKSVSRLTYLLDRKKNGTTVNAKTARGILTQESVKAYLPAEQELLLAAIRKYATTISQHLYVYEGVGDLGVAQIRQMVCDHMKLMNNRPVLIVDYMQILAPADIRATDKRNMDETVKALKLISRDFKIPIIGISSFNRESYNAPVNMSSSKESGMLEYGVDNLIGLQYLGMDYSPGESDRERQARLNELQTLNAEKARDGRKPIKIQLKILKQRYGPKASCLFDFYPKFNLYEESTNNTDLYDELVPIHG